jgi:AraC-like DNA-binding protein
MNFSTATVSGLRGTVRRMVTPTQGVTVVAVFQPLAAARFLRAPLHELFGKVVALSDLVPRALLAEIEETLAAAPNAAAQLRALETFLLRLRRDEPDDALARQGLDEILRARGNVRIHALARQLGSSQDRFEKRFRRVVGASPKQVASIARFRAAVAARAAGRSLTEVAHAAGYFDSAHLARVFRAVTGGPPGAFVEVTPGCSK